MKKELKKQGFTLIELLAVIVVLAVIALITTPIILNVMDKAKKGALEDSAYGLLESANIYYAEGTLENNIAKTEFTFKDGVQTSENKLSYKGKIENGSVRLYSDGKSALCITGGNYAAIKNVNDKKVSVVKGRCSYNTETEEYETNGLCKDLQDELDGIKSLGDATSKDILIDKTAYVKGQLVTGSMKNNGAISATVASGGSYTIPEGYHNGQGTVSAQGSSVTNLGETLTPTKDMVVYLIVFASAFGYEPQFTTSLYEDGVSIYSSSSYTKYSELSDYSKYNAAHHSINYQFVAKAGKTYTINVSYQDPYSKGHVINKYFIG